MDHVYKTRDYKVYNVKDFIKRFGIEELSVDLPKNANDIQARSQLLQNEYEEMRNDIQSVVVDYKENEFSHEGNDEEVSPFHLFSKEALNLQTIKYLKDENVRNKLEVKHYQNRRRYGAKLSETPKISEVPIEPDLIPYREAVLTVRFYTPFKYKRDKRSNPKYHQEFQVLSSQLLTELRDKIYCSCNFGPFYDISENPLQTETKSAEADKTNPGFFFIHDTFYNDTRNPTNPDYSEVILEWSKKHAYIRDFKTATMETTRFEDINVRIGYPCVYQHHAACEHLFTITSIEILGISDNLTKSMYPLLTMISAPRTFSCFLCGQREIEFIVTDCPVHVHNPMKVCEECFLSFHYVNGKKQYPFKAYRYYSAKITE